MHLQGSGFIIVENLCNAILQRYQNKRRSFLWIDLNSLHEILLRKRQGTERGIHYAVWEEYVCLSGLLNASQEIGDIGCSVEVN